MFSKCFIFFNNSFKFTLDGKVCPFSIVIVDCGSEEGLHENCFVRLVFKFGDLCNLL